MERPQSYHSFMWDNFFSNNDINPANVNIFNSNAPYLEAECVQYEEKIANQGGIDLFVGGIGPGGHISFNEPSSSLQAGTHIESLTRNAIYANFRFFDKHVQS